ncbi:hypothetical protein [Fimbriiglobus ruber]|uniref:Uncharacterized protein n=1 Tax=Fimbriiglobus ruber TaxID=1908690 RepID=A0A225DYA3_9BACT|nr:hypothetical protein [Fimbriiglobus ruber]OWK42229.1 hypothetical protein FRUB_04307 [Fimbriiglobus ruber]
MTEPFSYIKTAHLHSLKSVGHHMLHSARENGRDTAKPLAFIGFITVALGAKMLWEAYRQTEGGGRESRRSR